MLLDSMFEEIKIIMMGLDVKYKVKGENKDTPETKFSADRYLNAYQQVDNFFSHETYYIDAIKKSGLSIDDIIASDYALNPSKIPEIFRDAVLREQRKLIIENYVEMNDYFRVLNGLPASTDDLVYAKLQFYEDNGIEFKPVHDFTDGDILQLMASGGLAELKKMYPHAKYLKYLGPDRITPFVSRRAANFQVIKTRYEGDSDLLDRFLTIYDQNREYVMSVLYVKEFSASKPYYDNFMALTVVIMTVQRITVDVFKSGINMDFFDIGLIQMLFESYNVPFIEGLPMDFQKLLVRNLNKLLHYKSTDKVLYDICDILGFSNSAIYKYYLIKNHRFDEYGKPVFDYKENELGETVENVDTMYELYFQAMDIKEENEEFALLDNSNRATYETITVEDPYWWDEDDDLKKKLYESEFNYIETKYLHMNVMYKLTDMIFEIVHIYRIMQDKRSEDYKIDIGIPRILPSRKISLFTYTMFMCAALAKRNNLTGEVITSPSQTLYLFGFDFGKDLTDLKAAVARGSKYIDMNTVSKYIYDTDIRKASDVDRMFNNIKSLWEFLSQSLKNAKTIEEYRAYERLYRAIHVTQDMSSVFTKSDGTVAATYLDMLNDLDSELHDLIVNATDTELFDYINHCIDSIKEIVSGAKYLHGITDNSDILLDALNKLIRFFKSYSVDLREFNILYILDHRYLNAIKILDKLKCVEVDIDWNDAELRSMTADLINITSKMEKKDFELIRDTIKAEADFLLYIDMYSKMKYSSETSITLGMNAELLDIVGVDSTNTNKEYNIMRDEITIIREMA